MVRALTAKIRGLGFPVISVCFRTDLPLVALSPVLDRLEYAFTNVEHRCLGWYNYLGERIEVVPS